jgi:hypothetical protein
MNKEFIPYKQALELKELGFDEKCLAYYNINPIFNKPLLIEEPFNDNWCLPAPLYQQVFRWFREKYGIDISINTIYSKYNENTSKKYGGVIDNESVFTNVGFYDTYEEAELACLKKLIEILKNK